MSLLNDTSLIKQKALLLGFSDCGIARAGKLQEEEQGLDNYLSNAYHADMAYMSRNKDLRLDPTLLVPGAKSIVVVLANYFPEKKQNAGVPIVAKYAYGTDYHRVIKKKLRHLLEFIHTEIGPVSGRAFTDSAPVLERAWAVKAGLGWIGKNGMLINRKLGSFFFIGELVIDRELEYDAPYPNEYCGTCTRCLETCPTGALLKPGVLDARRCISWLTIEKKDDTPEALKSLLNRRIFGCDICQDVCPWNRNAAPTPIDEFRPDLRFLSMTTVDWMKLDENQFRERFRYTPLQRAGFEKLRMNINNCFPKPNPKNL
ncbi:MAG TPA: tRNA epoxyqueuosine(34) reductase QueG [Prolixibacteraceae bacterium]|nr:tRNA epoxyqueuosine(34) reductase QueG [Prolixibacteraceae bacterium]